MITSNTSTISNEIFSLAYTGRDSGHLLKWAVIDLIEEFGEDAIAAMPLAEGSPEQGISRTISAACLGLAQEVEAGDLTKEAAAVRLMPGHPLLSSIVRDTIAAGKARR